MKRLAFISLLALAAGCQQRNLNPPSMLPDASTCSAPVTIQAWAATTADASGGVTVFGATVAPDGVTVRAVLVAGLSVSQSDTDFNFRSWTVDIPADRLRALARGGQATLSVVAFTSDGCAELADPLKVSLSSDGGAVDDGGGGDGVSDGDAAIRDGGGDAE